MARSARIDGAMFRSLRDDNDATRQSILVLALAGLSFGLGLTVSIGSDLAYVLLGSLIGVVIGVGLGFIWLTLTYLVVTRIFRGSSSYWSLARPVFFATSPGLVFLLMIAPVPFFADIFRAIGLAWIALSNVYAVKNSMGFDNQRAYTTFIIVALIMIIAYGILTSI
ncbi:MAG TPA: YIP1 family protein [Candidatus Dormibacteraeota bacterium]|nr:YIP1 family protein [Candidatus Dormibacteraeota bacterium]